MSGKDLVDFSIKFKDIPYDFQFAKYNGKEGGYTVTLVTKDGDQFGSGTHESSFALAYTAAERAIEAKMQADYDDTINGFLELTGRI